jgi:hypothetical protein
MTPPAPPAQPAGPAAQPAGSGDAALAAQTGGSGDAGPVAPAETRRCVVVLLTPVSWAPPGVELDAWRYALAEDVVDLLTALAEVDVVLAAPPGTRPLAEAIRWPRMPVYDLTAATPLAALRAATGAGYHQAVVLPADAPDLPTLVLGKLFRPLTTRPVAAAPADPTPDDAVSGLVGLAASLPVAGWLADHDPDLDVDSLATLRAAARAAGASGPAAAPGWGRQRGPADLAALDPDLEGWESTRALLSQGAGRY